MQSAEESAWLSYGHAFPVVLSVTHTSPGTVRFLAMAPCHSAQSLLAELRIPPTRVQPYLGSERIFSSVFCRLWWEFLFSFQPCQAGWGPVTNRRAALSKCCLKRVFPLLPGKAGWHSHWEVERYSQVGSEGTGVFQSCLNRPQALGGSGPPW